MFCSAVSWDGRCLVGATSWQSPAAEFGCAVAAPPGMNAQQQGLATALLKTPEPGNASPRAGAPGTWGPPGKKGFGGILETPGTSVRAVSIPAGCGAPQSDAACRSHLTSEAPLSLCQNNDFSALGLKSQLPVNPAGCWEWLPKENPVCAPLAGLLLAAFHSETRASSSTGGWEGTRATALSLGHLLAFIAHPAGSPAEVLAGSSSRCGHKSAFPAWHSSSEGRYSAGHCSLLLETVPGEGSAPPLPRGHPLLPAGARAFTPAPPLPQRCGRNVGEGRARR